MDKGLVKASFSITGVSSSVFLPNDIIPRTKRSSAISLVADPERTTYPAPAAATLLESAPSPLPPTTDVSASSVASLETNFPSLELF